MDHQEVPKGMFKGKREKERYTHLNAEFQRIARRDKKTSSVITAKKETHTYVGNGFLRKILRPFHGKRVFGASGAGATAYSHARE